MKTINYKLLIRIFLAVIFLATLSFLLFNENGFLKFLKMKNELRVLNEDIRKAEERIEALDAEIDSLKTSKTKIEKVAREKFDMMKKNEKAFKIDEN
ncbi:MAG: septum formation initiator family protein [Ignavibacteriales bacterium]|nr:septum formation initiator family protein [Ignavibacteriales bacterium]